MNRRGPSTASFSGNIRGGGSASPSSTSGISEDSKRSRRKGNAFPSLRSARAVTTAAAGAALLLLIFYGARRMVAGSHNSRSSSGVTGTMVGKNNQGLRALPKTTIKTTPSPVFSKAALEMCTRTFWHTLESTTIVLPNAETFVHTGDIDDLWLRDSAAQIHPLLLPLFPPETPVIVDDTTANNNHQKVALIYNDARLDRVVAGLIARHALYIRHDPYANAFRIDNSYHFNEEQKRMGRHDLISTWNYELDSGCYTIRMLYYYWKQSNNGDAVIRENPAVEEAVTIMVDLWMAEQEHELDKYPDGPLFDCVNCRKPYRYPELDRQGKGSPTNATAGLTWTGFRPSDDACTYGFLVPANMFCAAVLNYVAEMAEAWGNQDLYENAIQLQTDIRRGIEDHAIVHHKTYGKIYAYEVDGLGNALLMDDANVPSLLSIPYLEYPFVDPEVYDNTRRFILSNDNPSFHQGTNPLTGPVGGIGSPHMAANIRQNVWPMAMAMEAMTETRNTERKMQLVEQLVQASAGTGWMHESFDVANPSSFTRSWFCWADSLFAEVVLRVLNETDSTQQCPDPTISYHILEWRDPEEMAGGTFAASMR